MESIIEILARELDCRGQYVENIIKLLDEGNTVPFIARYRKELHGGMDDQRIRTLADRLAYLRNLQARREEVKGAIENQGKLTCTAPTGRSGVPVPPWQRRRGWSPWPCCSSPKRRTVPTRWRRRPGTWTRRKV